MKIGVLSDIHLKQDDGRIRSIIEKHLTDVDMYFLCGDLTSMGIYDLFADKKVVAVAGNMDDQSIKNTLPIKRKVNLNGHTFGLIHGYGAPANMEKRIAKEFESVDCIVYGHSHAASNQRVGGTLFFNPGSATDRRFSPYCSVGILNVSESSIKGEIIKL
ncbi:metallophosphoesterase family protein [Thermodesulfobacteriota bacterium]